MLRFQRTGHSGPVRGHALRQSALAIVTALLASGCGGGVIEPSYVVRSRYEPFDCNALAQERVRLEGLLAAAVIQSDHARSEQVADVLFFNLPATTGRGATVEKRMTEQRFISELEGHIEAIQAVCQRKHCEP